MDTIFLGIIIPMIDLFFQILGYFQNKKNSTPLTIDNSKTTIYKPITFIDNVKHHMSNQNFIDNTCRYLSRVIVIVLFLYLFTTHCQSIPFSIPLSHNLQYYTFALWDALLQTSIDLENVTIITIAFLTIILLVKIKTNKFLKTSIKTINIAIIIAILLTNVFFFIQWSNPNLILLSQTLSNPSTPTTNFINDIIKSFSTLLIYAQPIYSTYTIYKLFYISISPIMISKNYYSNFKNFMPYLSLITYPIVAGILFLYSFSL